MDAHYGDRKGTFIFSKQAQYVQEKRVVLYIADSLPHVIEIHKQLHAVEVIVYAELSIQYHVLHLLLLLRLGIICSFVVKLMTHWTYRTHRLILII